MKTFENENYVCRSGCSQVGRRDYKRKIINNEHKYGLLPVYICIFWKGFFLLVMRLETINVKVIIKCAILDGCLKVSSLSPMKYC